MLLHNYITEYPKVNNIHNELFKHQCAQDTCKGHKGVYYSFLFGMNETVEKTAKKITTFFNTIIKDVKLNFPV